MSPADRSGGDSPFAILDVFRADPGDQPVLVSSRRPLDGCEFAGKLDACQGELGGFAVVEAADPLPFQIEQRYPFMG